MLHHKTWNQQVESEPRKTYLKIMFLATSVFLCGKALNPHPPNQADHSQKMAKSLKNYQIHLF